MRPSAFTACARGYASPLKYAGADDAAITVYDTADDLAAAVQKAGKPVVVLPNYTSMLTVRDKLSALAGGGRFWE